MRRTLLILALCTQSACMLSPFDGQVVEDSDEAIVFEGYYTSANADISIRAYDHVDRRWETVDDTTTSTGAVHMFGSRWYPWRTVKRLSGSYWEPAARGARARVKAVGPRGTHISLREDGSICLMDANRAGATAHEARARCAAEHSPEAWLYTDDYCAELTRPAPIYDLSLPSRVDDDGWIKFRVFLSGAGGDGGRGLGRGARITLRTYDGDTLVSTSERRLTDAPGDRRCYIDDMYSWEVPVSTNDDWKVIRCELPLSDFGLEGPCDYAEFTKRVDPESLRDPLYSGATRVEVELEALGECGGTRTATRAYELSYPDRIPCDCRTELYGTASGVCRP